MQHVYVYDIVTMHSIRTYELFVMPVTSVSTSTYLYVDNVVLSWYT